MDDSICFFFVHYVIDLKCALNWKLIVAFVVIVCILGGNYETILFVFSVTIFGIECILKVLQIEIVMQPNINFEFIYNVILCNYWAAF